MPFASAISTNPDTASAINEVAKATLEQLGDTPDVAILFASAEHGMTLAEQTSQLSKTLNAQALIGCTGESIVGNGEEVERRSAISLWLGKFSNVDIVPFRMEFDREAGRVKGWPTKSDGAWTEGSLLLVLADPFSFPADILLSQLNEEPVPIRVAGGMASASHVPGTNQIILGGESFDSGASAILLRGDVQATTVVSQGCRPIGEHFVITKADRNWIHELGGFPTMKKLEELFNTLATSEKRMVQQGLHIGRVVSEYQDRFEQGDFLVRNVIQADEETGGLAITDYVRAGQTVQFHIRDESTADSEMKQLMSKVESKPEGALLFTCNGRGTRLFSEPHHDAQVIQGAFGDIPLAGFFAAGELGPIGGKNFTHGFTASTVLFE